MEHGLRPRLYRLVPWLVRALIPPGQIGSYTLYQRTGTQAQVSYVGRSDTDLQRRLLTHAQRRIGAYFEFDVHKTREQAYTAESAAYHALQGETSNCVHPATPAGAAMVCPFCKQTFWDIQAVRLRARMGASKR